MQKPRLGKILHCRSYLLCPWVCGSGDRGTGRDISPPMTWCGTTAAGPMCARLHGGTSLERCGHPTAVFSPGALYTLLDCGG